MKFSLKSNDLALERKTEIIIKIILTYRTNIDLSYSFCPPFVRFCMLRFSNKALSVLAFFLSEKG